MTRSLDRRRFLEGTMLAGGALLAGAHETHAKVPDPPKLKKAVVLGMLNKLPADDRLKMARDLGFEGIEAYTTEDPKAVERLRAAADKAGIAIHSVMNSNHWDNPLSSDDPKKIAAGLQGMETSLRNAKAFGADTVLLVPAVVKGEVTHEQAWERSRTHIPKLIPLAAELGIVIAIENVWNNFLLKSDEFVRYVDEFKSPSVRAYFDVGNIVRYGEPQDWIRALGKRIVKIHVKDFDKTASKFVPLREGSVDWPAVHAALSEVGYSGWVTAELSGGDEAYLREVSARMDKIVAGQ
jgi:hexulose-6-phosphate isomerase